MFSKVFRQPLSKSLGAVRSKHIEAKIESLGFTLPPSPSPKGNYMPFVKSGNLVFLSGHLPQKHDGSLITGRLGDNMSVEEGQKAAQLIGLNLLSTLKVACDGDLDRVKRVVKLVAFVQCTNDFNSQPMVVNGCSDLLGTVFGPEIGRHARSAVGTNALPLGVAVEIEAVVEIA